MWWWLDYFFRSLPSIRSMVNTERMAPRIVSMTSTPPSSGNQEGCRQMITRSKDKWEYVTGIAIIENSGSRQRQFQHWDHGSDRHLYCTRVEKGTFTRFWDSISRLGRRIRQGYILETTAKERQRFKVHFWRARYDYHSLELPSASPL